MITETCGIKSALKKPLLSPRQERKLLKKYHRGVREKDDNLQHEAMDILVEHNVRLVMSIAQNYHAKHLDADDIFSIGVIGLMTAIHRFDFKKGKRLSTYANWWIKQMIARGIFNLDRAIRLPVYVMTSVTTIKTLEQQLKSELKRNPTDDELLEKLDHANDRGVWRQMDHISVVQDIGHLDAKLKLDNGAEDSSLYAVLKDEKVIDPQEKVLQQSQRQMLNELVEATLDRRGRVVIKLLYGLDDADPEKPEMTLQEVGDHLHISAERVRQIKHKSLQKLRNKVERSASLRDGLW